MRRIIKLMRRLSGFSEKAKTPTWGLVDQGRARSQGWGLFEARGAFEGGGVHYGWMLQKHDEASIFARDEHAWLFAYNQMLAGDPTAVRAFDFLETQAPSEYAAIMKFCRLANAA